MSVLEKFKSFAGFSDDTEVEEEEEVGTANSYDFSQGNDYSFHNQGVASSRRNINKVVNIHATTQLQVVVVKPERFEEVKGIADHLKAKKTVFINLESASKEIQGRIIDFLGGIAYAIDGKLSMITKYTYIIAPYTVDIAGDFLDELEGKGILL